MKFTFASDRDRKPVTRICEYCGKRHRFFSGELACHNKYECGMEIIEEEEDVEEAWLDEEEESLVDTISQHVELIEVGKYYKGECPFCGGTLFVYPNQKSWHCFGCDVGGYEIQFTNRIRGII